VRKPRMRTSRTIARPVSLDWSFVIRFGRNPLKTLAIAQVPLFCSRLFPAGVRVVTVSARGRQASPHPPARRKGPEARILPVFGGRSDLEHRSATRGLSKTRPPLRWVVGRGASSLLWAQPVWRRNHSKRASRSQRRRVDGGGRPRGSETRKVCVRSGAGRSCSSKRAGRVRRVASDEAGDRTRSF
jgi:hypothetical protein